VRVPQALASAILLVGPATRAQADFEMRPPEDPGGAPSVVGGTPANPAEWPASLRFERNGEMCSATVIGSQVVITAAHCVAKEETGKLLVGTDQLDLTCYRNHNYVEGDDSGRYDLALCLSTSHIKLVQSPNTFRPVYERVSTDANLPKEDANITIQGYGCIESGGPPKGVLYNGEAIVKAVWLSTFTFDVGGGAASCFGDSGGAALVALGEFGRAIVGITSHGDTFSETIFVRISDPEISSYIIDWGNTHHVTICGINEPTTNCHP
jgi:secreted trypsin-like serine protease